MFKIPVNYSKQSTRKSKGINAQKRLRKSTVNSARVTVLNKQHRQLSKHQSSKLVSEDSKRRLSKAVAKVLADDFLSNLENELLQVFLTGELNKNNGPSSHYQAGRKTLTLFKQDRICMTEYSQLTSFLLYKKQKEVEEEEEKRHLALLNIFEDNRKLIEKDSGRMTGEWQKKQRFSALLKMFEYERIVMGKDTERKAQEWQQARKEKKRFKKIIKAHQITQSMRSRRYARIQITRLDKKSIRNFKRPTRRIKYF
jgi:hypothetical protein